MFSKLKMHGPVEYRVPGPYPSLKKGKRAVMGRKLKQNGSAISWIGSKSDFQSALSICYTRHIPDIWQAAFDDRLGLAREYC